MSALFRCTYTPPRHVVHANRELFTLLSTDELSPSDHFHLLFFPRRLFFLPFFPLTEIHFGCFLFFLPPGPSPSTKPLTAFFLFSKCPPVFISVSSRPPDGSSSEASSDELSSSLPTLLLPPLPLLLPDVLPSSSLSALHTDDSLSSSSSESEKGSSPSPLEIPSL